MASHKSKPVANFHGYATVNLSVNLNSQGGVELRVTGRSIMVVRAPQLSRIRGVEARPSKCNGACPIRLARVYHSRAARRPCPRPGTRAPP